MSSLQHRFPPLLPAPPLDGKSTMVGLGPDRTQVYIDLAARLPLQRTPTAERIGELTMLAAGSWMVRPLARPLARVSRHSGPLAVIAGFTMVVLVTLVVLGLRVVQGV